MASPIFERVFVLYIVMAVVLTVIFFNISVTSTTNTASTNMTNAIINSTGAITTSSQNSGIFDGIFLVGTLTSQIVNALFNLQIIAKLAVIMATGLPIALADAIIAVGGILQTVFDIIIGLAVIAFIRG